MERSKCSEFHPAHAQSTTPARDLTYLVDRNDPQVEIRVGDDVVLCHGIGKWHPCKLWGASRRCDAVIGERPVRLLNVRTRACLSRHAFHFSSCLLAPTTSRLQLICTQWQTSLISRPGSKLLLKPALRRRRPRNNSLTACNHGLRNSTATTSSRPLCFKLTILLAAQRRSPKLLHKTIPFKSSRAPSNPRISHICCSTVHQAQAKRPPSLRSQSSSTGPNL